MNITFNSNLLNNLLYITNIQGLGMPQTMDRTIAFVNGNGAFYSNTDFDQRVVTLECAMIPNTNKTIYEKLDEIKTILSPFLGEKELIFECYPNRYVKGRYSGNMNIEQLGMLQKFPITFMCADPLFYELVLQNTALSAGVSTNIINKGSAQSSDVTIKLTLGASQTIAIQNLTTGKYLNIKNPDATAKIINIDFKNGNILDQSLIQNYNKVYLSGEFFLLNPGTNALKVSAGTSISVQYRSAWL